MRNSRLVRAIQEICKATFSRYPYAFRHRYRVVAMSGHRATLQVINRDLGVPDLVAIPLYPGVPGVSSLLAIGTVVLVDFAEGDASLPYITGFCGPGEAGDKPESVTLDGEEVLLGSSPRVGVARLGDAVQAGPFAGTITFASTTVKAGA